MPEVVDVHVAPIFKDTQKHTLCILSTDNIQSCVVLVSKSYNILHLRTQNSLLDNSFNNSQIASIFDFQSFTLDLSSSDKSTDLQTSNILVHTIFTASLRPFYYTVHAHR